MVKYSQHFLHEISVCVCIYIYIYIYIYACTTRRPFRAIRVRGVCLQLLFPSPSSPFNHKLTVIKSVRSSHLTVCKSGICFCRSASVSDRFLMAAGKSLGHGFTSPWVYPQPGVSHKIRNSTINKVPVSKTPKHQKQCPPRSPEH